MLPLKAGILNWTIDHKDQGFTPDDLVEALKPIYNGEKQCNYKRIEAYCQDFTMNGFFVPKKIKLKKDGSSEITYRVTDYAIDRGNRFIPGRKKK